MKWKRKLMAVIPVFAMILSLIYSPVPVGAAAIGIESITISEATSQGFRITAKLIAEAGVKEVLMPTWTEANGQDELKWYKASVNGNQATYYVPASEHKNESGKYITHVYLYDNQGKMVLKGTEAVLPAVTGPATNGSKIPTIQNIRVTEVSAAGYRVTAEVAAADGIREVLMPSWSDNGGQDDVKWHKAQVINGTATCYISTAEHKNDMGLYQTHIYVRDMSGREIIMGTTAEVTGNSSVPGGSPNYGNGTFSIGEVWTTDVSSSGFKVWARLNSPNGVKEVVMPTWTEANGQDDLVWHKADVYSGEASFYVKTSEHKNETGKYITHIYLYDRDGKEVIKGLETIVPAAQSGNIGNAGNAGNNWGGSAELAIQRAEVINVTPYAYTVKVTFNAPAGIKEVVMPTWTEANGQDDLVWHTAVRNGSTEASFTVNISDHKAERGKYITHVYVRDLAGKEVIKGVEVTVPQPNTPSGGNTPSGNPSVTPGVLEIKNVTVTEVTQAGYRVSAFVNAPAGIKEVVMPTWTEVGGQDDLVWHKAEVANGVATYYVKASDHWNGSGKYITHIYLRDLAGKEVIVGAEAVVPTAQSGSAPNGGQTGGNAPGGNAPGGNTPGGSIPGGNTGSLLPLTIGQATVSERTAAGYRVTVQISAPAGISKVEMPTWTAAGGQDDLVWHVADFTTTSATCYIPISSHNNESGTYTTHIYVYDKAGKKAIAGVETTIPSASGGNTPGGNTGGLPTGGNAGKLTVSIPFVTAINSSGYTIQVTFSAPMGAQRIAAAVWTTANGQDDLVWHEMEITGDRAVARIPVSSHNNEHGVYTTNVYVFDSTGAKVLSEAHVPVP